jgi:hypothetical protein
MELAAAQKRELQMPLTHSLAVVQAVPVVFLAAQTLLAQ